MARWSVVTPDIGSEGDMTTETYPDLIADSLDDVLIVLREILLVRSDDITQFTNLDSRFLPGRSTERVPSSNSDVVATDEKGDVVNDSTYEYKLVDDSGTLKWDRRTLDIAW